jgi:hypothetical protein
VSDRDTLTEALKRTHLPNVYRELVAVIMAGWRPPARDSWGEAWQRIHGNWRHISGRICVADELVLNFGPKFTVLHDTTEDPDCPHDSRSGADGRWRCDQCGADCGPDTYLTPTEEKTDV